jgi:hypothetical protein
MQDRLLVYTATIEGVRNANLQVNEAQALVLEQSKLLIFALFIFFEKRDKLGKVTSSGKTGGKIDKCSKNVR